MKTLICYTLLLLLTALTIPLARAESHVDIAEIIRSLEADAFWTNRPITIQFAERISMRESVGKGANDILYRGTGLLTKDGFRALARLDTSNTSPAAADSTAIRKFFIKSNDYAMSYFLNPTNTAKGQRKGNAGEATVGSPPCNCTEKFWAFPLTPAVVAQKLRILKNATCLSTNFQGRAAALVIGTADDEKAVLEWRMLFQRSGPIWLPLKTDVYFHDQLLTTIEAFFDHRSGYPIEAIRLTLFRAGQIVSTFNWNNIKASVGDHTGDTFAGMEAIPAGVIVTDYRFKKPTVYLMAKAKTATATQTKPLRLDVPPIEKQKLPENAVQVVFVRLALIALAVLPIGWVPRVRVVPPTTPPRSTALNRYFVLCSAAILSVTALAKVVSVFSNAPLMLQADPLLEVPFRYLLLIAALAELTVVAACIFTKGIKRHVMLIAWLSTVFLAYRIGLWFIDWHRPCHCLGDLTEMLHIAPAVADNLMKGVLLFLLLGSYANLFFIWRGKKQCSLPMEHPLQSENLVETL